MNTHLMFILIISTALMINAQLVNIRGNVTDKAGKAISDAILTLAVQGLKDTTGADGAFLISKPGVGVANPINPYNERIMMDKGILEFTLNCPSQVKVEMYDVSGTLLKKETMRNAPAGVFHMNLASSPFAEKLLVIKATIGSRSMTFRYLPISGKFAINSSLEGVKRNNGGFAKVAEVVDTLKVSANGFRPGSFPLNGLDTTVNITLDSLNGSTGSIGCGKDLGSLKSGTYKITSAGLDREYIIDIPANYDKNKPYRLIFGMHCFGSSMQGVANDKYYQLKRFADSTKTPVIFVAPNGTWSNDANNYLWNQAEKDHAFFDDMLSLLKEKLCVDTARVFSCGFSYGAMFTNSLSLNHQKNLRAVACYAPANWNIYLPEIVHEPIAYMSITGNSDPNCPFVYDDAKKQGGKYCVLTRAEDNGCTMPSNIPTESSGSRKHSVYEFQGCKEGYPVKFFSFDGAHQSGPMDGVSGDNPSKSWVPGETWKFFMQF
ncbi:MAG TPA: hypothetical protein VHP36_08935 [Chitinispirillaceae bacterium]|nr:hypothetical protein [Chitinispirillaceae bacterium]